MSPLRSSNIFGDLLVQLEARLGTEAIALSSFEQVNSRDVDPSPARQESDEVLQSMNDDRAKHSVSNVPVQPDNPAEHGQQPHSPTLRHDASEL